MNVRLGCKHQHRETKCMNRLQLNMDKTEFMWCTSVRQQHPLHTTNITVGSTLVTPSTSVRDLGIYIDKDLVMRTPYACPEEGFTLLRHVTSAAQYLSG
jgi:hypothetical protein